MRCIRVVYLTIAHCSEAGGGGRQLTACMREIRLEVTAVAARRPDVCHRRGWSGWNLEWLYFSILGQISGENIGTRTETVSHIMLKCQAARACFHGGELSANIDGKVEQEERERERKKERKKERIEHPQ